MLPSIAQATKDVGCRCQVYELVSYSRIRVPPSLPSSCVRVPSESKTLFHGCNCRLELGSSQASQYHLLTPISHLGRNLRANRQPFFPAQLVPCCRIDVLLCHHRHASKIPTVGSPAASRLVSHTAMAIRTTIVRRW